MDDTRPRNVLRWCLFAALTTASALLALVALSMVPPAFAQESEPDPNPVGSCFGGTFDQDPVHCYAFEQAYAANKLDIEAMYKGGGALFVYLARTEPISDSDIDFLFTKAKEEASRSGEHSCLLEEQGCGRGVYERSTGGFVLPVSNDYEVFFLRSGGEAALRDELGWPSFRKLWPDAEGRTDEARGAADSVDVTGVDTTNFPALDCDIESYTGIGGACRAWERYPDLGVAGIKGGLNVVYVQVKVRPGQEDVDLEAAKAALHRGWTDYDEGDIIVVPVKYDYEELWRWSLLLQRFSETSANALGVTSAYLGENLAPYRGRVLFPEAGPTKFPVEEFPMDYTKFRTTIHVRTLEFERTVTALPELLSQLGIPADAVGVVSEVVRTLGSRMSDDVDVGGAALREVGSAGNGDVGAAPLSVFTWLLAVAVIVSLVGVALFIRRSRRQPA